MEAGEAHTGQRWNHLAARCSHERAEVEGGWLWCWTGESHLRPAAPPATTWSRENKEEAENRGATKTWTITGVRSRVAGVVTLKMIYLRYSCTAGSSSITTVSGVFVTWYVTSARWHVLCSDVTLQIRITDEFSFSRMFHNLFYQHWT